MLHTQLYSAGDDLPCSSTAGSSDYCYSGDSADDEDDDDDENENDDDDDSTVEGSSAPGK